MNESIEREKSSAEAQHWGPPWLTVEFALYLLLMLIAAILRLYALGRQPLQEREAHLAVDAWRFYTGGAASIRGHSPLLFNGNVLLYLLFGASDYVARLIPALAGSVMVGLPYLLRSYLGRRGALISAAILTFSPSFVFFSRQLQGDIIVSASALVLLVGIFGYIERRRDSHLCLLAGALALSLMAGGASYMLLLALGAFFLGLSLYSRFGGGGESSLRVRVGLGNGRTLRYAASLRSAATQDTIFRPGSRQAWLKAGGIFAALILLVSTGLFINVQGLQATLDLLSGWLSQFPLLTDGQPWHYYLSLLMAYELPVFVFGLAGACYLARRDLFSALLVCWFGASLILYSLMGTKPPSGLLQILLPLTLLAGKMIGELLNKIGEGERWVWDRLVLLISVPVIFHMIVQLAAFANPENPGEPRHLIMVFLSLFFLLCIIVITGALAVDWRGTLRIGGLILLLILAGFMVQATWRLNYHRPGNPLEPLVERPTSPDIRNLVRMIEDTSNQRERERHTIDITVTGGEDPLLAWYLRSFPNLAVLSDSQSSLTPVVITPLGEPVSLPDYRGARFRLQSWWRAEGLAGHARLRWYLYREALSPPVHYEVVMWVAP